MTVHQRNSNRNSKTKKEPSNLIVFHSLPRKKSSFSRKNSTQKCPDLKK